MFYIKRLLIFVISVVSMFIFTGFCSIPQSSPKDNIVVADNISFILEFNNYYSEEIPLDIELQYTIYCKCSEYDLDYYVIIGLIQNESNFVTDVVNETSGCYGLMQLNPEYFPSDLDAKDNIIYGIDFLASCIEDYDGDLAAGMCMYANGYDTGDRAHYNTVMEYADNWRKLYKGD